MEKNCLGKISRVPLRPARWEPSGSQVGKKGDIMFKKIYESGILIDLFFLYFVLWYFFDLNTVY